jgi:hypothetical protein
MKFWCHSDSRREAQWWIWCASWEAVVVTQPLIHPTTLCSIDTSMALRGNLLCQGMDHYLWCILPHKANVGWGHHGHPMIALLGKIIRACPRVAHQTHSRVQPYLNEPLVERPQSNLPQKLPASHESSS